MKHAIPLGYAVKEYKRKKLEQTTQVVKYFVYGIIGTFFVWLLIVLFLAI